MEKYFLKGLKIISLVVLLAAGPLALLQFKQGPDIRESYGSSLKNLDKNLEIVETRSDLLLPDMNLMIPEELYIQISGGKKFLRFNTTFFNDGDGPLELIGETDEERDVVVATQVIDKSDGTEEEMVVGAFVYHPGHSHWHVNNYAQFQLLRYDEETGKATDVVASTEKYSFCIWDEHPYDLSLENASQTAQYPRCPKNVQGNSVGWGDTYRADVEGQEIDITGIEDGNYLIRSTVNADNSILEKDYTNNTATAYVEIEGNNIKFIEGP